MLRTAEYCLELLLRIAENKRKFAYKLYQNVICILDTDVCIVGSNVVESTNFGNENTGLGKRDLWSHIHCGF